MFEGVQDGAKVETAEPQLPPNGFYTFLQSFKETFASQNPSMSENEICRAAGRSWLLMGDDMKVQWRTHAKEERAKFREDYPDYDDRPKKKKEPETKIEPIGVRVEIDYNLLKQTPIPPLSVDLTDNGIIIDKTE